MQASFGDKEMETLRVFISLNMCSMIPKASLESWLCQNEPECKVELSVSILC